MSPNLDLLSSFWTPHAGQEEFLCAPERYRVLACGRRWGKTDACAASLVLEILGSSSSRQLILAPTLPQAEILFDRVVEFAEFLWPDEVKIRRARYPCLWIGDHKVWARSGHVTRSLRGQGATHIIVDEAAYVASVLITDIAFPMLATSHGRLTLLSTPFGKNHFWRFFRRGVEGEEHFWSRQAPSSESPYVSQDFLAIQRELISERAFAVEYEAEFVDSSTQVFKTEAIEKCTVLTLPKPTGPYTIGIDWARYSDYTAIAVLSGDANGCQVVHLERFTLVNWEAQVRRVAELVKRFPSAQIRCDSTGVGDPVNGMLQRELTNHRVVDVLFTAPVKRHLIDGLAMLFERGAIKMTLNPDLHRELQHFEAQHRDSGNIRLAAPSGYHDDLVIALALAANPLLHPYSGGIAAAGTRDFNDQTL